MPQLRKMAGSSCCSYSSPLPCPPLQYPLNPTVLLCRCIACANSFPGSEEEKKAADGRCVSARQRQRVHFFAFFTIVIVVILHCCIVTG